MVDCADPDQCSLPLLIFQIGQKAPLNVPVNTFVAVVLSLNVLSKQLWSCRDGQLTQPHYFWVVLDLLSTKCPYFGQLLTAAHLEPAEG